MPNNGSIDGILTPTHFLSVPEYGRLNIRAQGIEEPLRFKLLLN